MEIKFILNGQMTTVTADPGRRVIDLLREDLKLTGAKECCGAGECGACTILVDGKSRLSCLMIAAQLTGRTVLTIEGVATDGTLRQLQLARRRRDRTGTSRRLESGKQR